MIPHEKMTPKDLRKIRKALGMTVAQFAAAAGVTPKKVMEWEGSRRNHLPENAVICIEFAQGKADLTNAKAE